MPPSLPPPGPPGEQRTVNVHGRTRSYLDRRRIRRRDYYLLEYVGSPRRERYLAFDPLSGPGGNFFLVQAWPDRPLAQQRLRVLKRLKDDCLPRAVEWERKAPNIEVVLTWVEGIPLSDYLKLVQTGRRPPPEPREAVRLIRGLASAVCKLHQKEQVAHGDIQPPNVILTSHTSRLVLIDFGSSWTTESAAFREEGDGLHRCYAPPELQAPGNPNGFHADQFSVTVLLYQLLTQQIPYGGLGGKAGRPENIAKTQGSLVPPSRLSGVCRRLPGSLREGVDRIVMRGLALDPCDRFPDRHAWLDALFEVYARFRLPPELSPFQNAMTGVIRWFVRPRKAE